MSKQQNTALSTNVNNGSNGSNVTSLAAHAAKQGAAQPSVGGAPRAGKRPYKLLWMVEDRRVADGSSKGFWTKVGVAFENRDGSYTLELAAIPVNGRLQMREPAAREAEVA